jgi:hypothetical protein
MRGLKCTLAAVFILVATAIVATAQNEDLKKCNNSSEVGCVIPKLFGAGITLPPGQPGDHVAHFVETEQFFSNFLPLNSAIATQLALLPIASPASGFTYSYQEITGATYRTPQTFGPILTERGETIGRGRILAGANYQRFRFDKIDGAEMDQLPGVLKHIETGRATNDIITTASDFSLKVNQYSFLGIVGVTSSFDVAVAVPVNNVRLKVTSIAQIQRISTTNNDCPAGTATPCHFFDPNAKSTSTGEQVRGSANATGLGDITARFKYAVANTESVAVAVLTDVRFPSGNERNFLGSGAWGVRPFAAFTYRTGRVAPHFNIGFQWNGQSVLAGNLLDGTKKDLPNAFYYGAGTDIGVIEDRLTLIFDAVGQRLLDAPRVSIGSYTAANNSAFPQVVPTTDSFGINQGGVGAKVKLSDRLLLIGNVGFSLDSGGLRQRALPLVGLSYLF